MEQHARQAQTFIIFGHAPTSSGGALTRSQHTCPYGSSTQLHGQLSTKHNDLVNTVLCNTSPRQSDCVITASNESSKPAALPWIQSPDEPSLPKPPTEMHWPKTGSQKSFLTSQQPVRATKPQLCLTFLLGSPLLGNQTRSLLQNIDWLETVQAQKIQSYKVQCNLWGAEVV